MKRGPRYLAIFAPTGFQLTDVSGPVDVFTEANRQAGRPIYRLELVAARRGAVESSSGVRLLPDRVLGSADRQRPHTFLVAGAPDLIDRPASRKLVELLDQEVAGARRYGSVCSGACLLAATGRLDGRRVTTHWGVADRLAERHPALRVEKDALHVRDGPVRTAAGVTAGMDLALAIVTEDTNRELAMKVASRLVMFFKRPGGQMQFSRGGAVAPTSRSTFQELQRWAAANPAEDLAVPRLAERVGLSTRHFSRLFRAETGVSPAAWVEAARVEAARTMIESTGRSPKQIARRCGFSDVNLLRRAFKRHTGVTPSEYSKRFR